MSSDLVSLADASALLGLSVERVRQLVIAGDLPGMRFGNAWAVPRESIDARRLGSNQRGRPLGGAGAWKRIAAGDVDLSNPSRYRNRGALHRFEMSGADLAFISQHEQCLVSGVKAAAGFGQPLKVEGAKRAFYVADALFEEFVSLVAAVPNPMGSAVFRVVTDDLWPFVKEHSVGGVKGFAPPAAVALDLVDSGDPRHWIAAERLLEDCD